MTFQYRPANRSDGSSGVCLGITGPSRSGKTFSALRVAIGMAGGDVSKVFCIDTESGRALMYADILGPFMHMPFDPPFTSERYTEALETARAAGARVIVVDSASHEHNGIGGLLDQKEANLDRMAGQDYAKRERMTFTAWIKPKAAHDKFVNTVLQMNMHMVFCFRAKEKLKLVKDRNGKTEPVPQGWQPICAKDFEYEMTAMLVLPEGANGVPDYAAEATGLRAPIADIFKPGLQLDEGLGELLDRWANSGGTGGGKSRRQSGGAKVDRPAVTEPPGPEGVHPDVLAQARADARAEARKGNAARVAYWNGLTRDERSLIAAIRQELADLANAADAASAGGDLDDEPSARSDAEAVEALHRMAREKAGAGTDAFTDWFNEIAQAEQEALYAIMDELQNIATHADATGGKKDPFARHGGGQAATAA